MPRLPSAQKQFFDLKLHLFSVDFWNSFAEVISFVFGHGNLIPLQVERCNAEMTELKQRIATWNPSAGELESSDTEAAILRHAIVKSRLREARYIESQSLKTFHGELLDRIAAPLSEFDTVMASDWFLKAEQRGFPKIGDFIPVEYVEKWEAYCNRRQDAQAEREFDEKFHILWAPNLLFSDLEEFRSAGELRGLPFAVAFLDIDFFKKFNERYTETVVDRDLRPNFMRCIEAHVYGRGRAYRQGGDEYVVLLHNATEQESVAFMDALRAKLHSLLYRGITEKTNVSVGLVCVGADCHLTNRELLGKASKAKAFAKSNGRNRIATYSTPFLGEAELRIAGGTG